MFNEADYIQADIPSLTSEKAKDYANELYSEWKYFDEATQDMRKEIWPACASAWMCKRELPEMEAADFADTSDLGETDVKDGIDFLADATTNALLPRDQSAFTLVPEEEEDQAALNSVRDLLASECRKADLRNQYGKHVRQTMMYGTSALWVRWEKDYRTVKAVKQKEAERFILDMAEEQGLDRAGVQSLLRTKELIRNRPVIQPIDMYDFWLDPAADLATDPEVGWVMRTYKTVNELKRAVGSDGEPVYNQAVLKDVEPMDIKAIYDLEPYRYDPIVDMGLNPLAQMRAGTKLVPVHIFHKFVRCFDDESEYIDTYFYVACCGTSPPRLIRIQENYGSRCVFVDTYTDWIGSAAYGIGAVEKSLQAYYQKNVLSALTLNAQLATVFPSYSVIGDVVTNDRGIKLGPGTLNTIKFKPSVGMNYIAPLPVPQGGVQLGMMDQQWLGQKILSQLQGYGALLQDPTKTVTQAKTATQINTESTSGSITRDNLLEKFTIRSLEPALQYILDSLTDNLIDGDKPIRYDRNVDGEISLGTVTPDVLKKKRRVVMTGFHGTMNKQMELQELREALAVLLQSNVLEIMPQLKPAAQDTVLRLLGRLGVRDLEKYKMSPVEILLQDPLVQQQLQGMGQQAFQAGAQAAMSGQMPPAMQSETAPQQLMGGPEGGTQRTEPQAQLT